MAGRRGPRWVGAAWSLRFGAFVGLFRMSGTGMLLCPAEYDEEEIAREGGNVSKRRQFIHCQWAPPGTEGEGEPGVVGTVGKFSLRRHRSPSTALRSCPRYLSTGNLAVVALRHVEPRAEYTPSYKHRSAGC